MTPHADGGDDDLDRFLRRSLVRLMARARSVAVQTDADHHALLSHAVVVLWRRWADLVDVDDGTRLSFAAVTMANGARDQRKRSAHRHEIPDDGSRTVAERAVPPEGWGDDPEFEVLRRERRLAILQAISRLPEEERTFMVFRTQGVGLARIALETGCSVQDVRNGLARAKRALRRDLGLPEGGGDAR